MYLIISFRNYLLFLLNSFITTVSNNPVKPGGFFDCGSERYEQDGNYYVVKHPNLKWVSVSNETLFDHPNAILVGGNEYLFYIVRKYFYIKS